MDWVEQGYDANQKTDAGWTPWISCIDTAATSGIGEAEAIVDCLVEYEVLEERGFEVKLVDARKVKNVSGRKNDVLDCQWLQELESYGLLAGAFRPADEIVILRGYMRQRQMLVKTAACETKPTS